MCDSWNFGATYPVVYVGGNYSQNGNHGMFYVNYTSLTNTNANHGSRHLSGNAKIPHQQCGGDAALQYTAQITALLTEKISE